MGQLKTPCLEVSMVEVADIILNHTETDVFTTTLPVLTSTSFICHTFVMILFTFLNVRTATLKLLQAH